MKQIANESRQAVLLNVRPKTAATTTYYDESRIKDKIDYLEKIEQNLDLDIEKIMQTPSITKSKKKTVKLTK